MKNARNIQRILPGDAFKSSLKLAYEKVASDVKSQSSSKKIGLEYTNDFFIGLLLVRMLEESAHRQRSAGPIGKLWAEYKGNRKPSGFHTVARQLSASLKMGDLGLLKRFADAIEHLNLSDTTWAHLIEHFLYDYTFDCQESDDYFESIGPDVLAWTNEYVSKWSAQKSSGVFYTSTAEARLVAQLATGYWIERQLEGPGFKDTQAQIRMILPSLLTGSMGDLNAIDSDGLRRLKEILTQVRIIDPACGSGALLVESFRLLLTIIQSISVSLSPGLDNEKIGRSIVERSLFGFDTDSRAIAITEARLWLCLASHSKNFAKKIKTNLAEKDGLLAVFGNDRFDIVIGNPPFVRHESINSPGTDRESYNRNLRSAVKGIWPGVSINGRADLHTFFFYLGVSMLKTGGVICYVAPNAWLDVDYGEQLRDFLLRDTDLRLLLNPSRRRFTAGVNTLIVVALATEVGTRYGEEPVIFVTPTLEMEEEDILSVAFNPSLNHRNSFRLVNKRITDRISNGALTQNNGTRQILSSNQRWSTYFRAPDIFFDLMRKLDGRLKPLGHIGKVRYPIKTGINEFFFISQKQAEERLIESDYLVPVVKSTREFSSYQLKTGSKTFLFCCDKSLSELKALRHRGALQYIKWGGGQSTKHGIPWPLVPSVSSRKHWYAVPRLDPADILCNRFFDRRFFFGYSDRPVIEDQTFYGLTLNGGKKVRLLQTALLNSALSYLLVELFGRVSLGEGVLQYAKYEMELLPVLDARELSSNDEREIVEAFIPLMKRPIKSIFEEIIQDDRQRFDLLIGRKIGLTEFDVHEILSAVSKMVRVRLDKAASILG